MFLTVFGHREMTSFSDYPMDPTISLFPTCTEMETYLRGYAAHFHLSSYIRFQTTVTNVSRIENSSTKVDRWLVAFRDGISAWPLVSAHFLISSCFVWTAPFSKEGCR